MPRLPRILGQVVTRALERLGFVEVRLRGSHVVLQISISKGSTVGSTVPLTQQPAIETLAGILRQAQVTPEEFMANL